MTVAVREQILEWIVATLPNRVTQANGYHHDLSTVRRSIRSFDLDELANLAAAGPVVVVTRGREAKEEDICGFTPTLDIEIGVWTVFSASSTTVGATLDSYIQDVEEFVVWADDNDRKFGGLALRVTRLENSFDLLDDPDEKVAGGVVTFGIEYRHGRFDHGAVVD